VCVLGDGDDTCFADFPSGKYAINKIMHPKKTSDKATLQAITAAEDFIAADHTDRSKMSHIVLDQSLYYTGHRLKRKYQVTNTDLQDHTKTFVMYCTIQEDFRCKRFKGGYSESAKSASITQQLLLVKNACIHCESIHRHTVDAIGITKQYVKLPVRNHLTLVNSNTMNSLLTTDTSCIRDIIAVFEVTKFSLY
jgi:hypothetical protein